MDRHVLAVFPHTVRQWYVGHVCVFVCVASEYGRSRALCCVHHHIPTSGSADGAAHWHCSRYNGNVLHSHVLYLLCALSSMCLLLPPLLGFAAMPRSCYSALTLPLLSRTFDFHMPAPSRSPLLSVSSYYVHVFPVTPLSSIVISRCRVRE
jgi:hypothetical protein